MPMSGTCQVFDFASGLLVFADGPARREKVHDGNATRDYLFIRYVHRTLPPRMRIITLAFNDFSLYHEHGRPINETLSYLNSAEQTFLLSGLTDDEITGS